MFLADMATLAVVRGLSIPVVFAVRVDFADCFDREIAADGGSSAAGNDHAVVKLVVRHIYCVVDVVVVVVVIEMSNRDYRWSQLSRCEMTTFKPVKIRVIVYLSMLSGETYNLRPWNRYILPGLGQCSRLTQCHWQLRRCLHCDQGAVQWRSSNNTIR